MQAITKMTPEQANALRCAASEIIIKLFCAGEKDQLRVLFVTAQEAVKQIEDSPIVR